MKDLVLGDEATRRTSEALEKIALAIGSTLGPSGRSAIIDRYEPALRRTRPVKTKDGVTVLGHIQFEDSVEHAIHGLCESAALQSVTAAGDGTSSTIVLANALAKAILKQNSKTPQAFSREVLKHIKECENQVDKYCLDQTDTSFSYMVAKTSANGDEEIAKIAQDVVSSNSKYSNVIIQKDPSNPTRYGISKCDGYVGGNGYRRFRQLATTIDRRANDMLYPIELKKCGVVLINGNLTKYDDVKHVADQVWGENSTCFDRYDTLLFVAFSVDENILNDIMMFNREYNKKIMVTEVTVNASVTGHGFHVLQDIEAFVGGCIHDPLHEFSSSFVGDCGVIEITGTKTTFKGRSKNNKIKQRCKENNELLGCSEYQYERDIIAARNAELAEGLVTIIVGGGQNADVQERADTLDDAVRAAQSAKHGVVAGGGLIYSRVAQGVQLPDSIKDALNGISKCILNNYGEDFDFQNHEKYGDKNFALCIDSSGVRLEQAQKCGVVDSATAVKSVLRQSALLATLIATTRCLSLDNRQKERNNLSLMKDTIGPGSM